MSYTSSDCGPTQGRPIAINGEFSIDLEVASRGNLVNYGDCADGPLEIESLWPEDQTQHLSNRQPPIRVRFDQEIEPDTVTNDTFQLGFPNTSGELVTAPGRLLKDDDAVWFVPDTPLRGGVRYTARVKVGDEGVRSKSGAKLEDSAGDGWQSWKFTTSIDFAPDGDSSSLLACHMYQTARDVPLIVGKPAMARVYANWKKYPDIHPDAQVRDFSARVALRFSDGSDLASMQHRFVRPDLWKERGLDKAAAEHTAQVLDFEPYAGMLASTRVSLQVPTEPGEGLSPVYSARCPSVLWDKSPRLKVDTFFLKVGEIGTDEELLAQTAPVVRDLVSKARIYAWQLFPVEEIEFSIPRFADPPILPSSPSSCDPACWLEGGRDGDTWEGLGDWLRTQSSADIIVVVGSREIFGGGGTTVVELSEGQGLLAMSVSLNPAHLKRFVNGLVHELGHVLGIEHVPYVTAADLARLSALRDGAAPIKFEGIEGFRMSRDGSVAWNKSSQEGNEEGEWLTPLMFPATIDTGEAFIANHQYRRIQELFDKQ